MDSEALPRFRHEYKYLINTAQARCIREKMAHLMKPDPYAPEGFYHITSLYFDTPHRACLQENQAGSDPREKFRIRLYNHDPERILSLECKHRERTLTRKTACPLTREQVEQLMAGRPLPEIAHQPRVLQKLTLLMLKEGMGPALLVDYDRIPFVYGPGNVRITLDLNVAASRHISSFLEKDYPRRLILPADTHLLEVKWDSFLPDVIYRSLQTEQPIRTSFSKYALCAQALEV